MICCMLCLLQLTASVTALAFSMLASSFVNVTIGTPLSITWSGGSGLSSLILCNGSASDEKPLWTLFSTSTETSFSWTQDSDLSIGTYAFEIIDSDGTPNYSQQFLLYRASESSTLSSSKSSIIETQSPSSTTSTRDTSSGAGQVYTSGSTSQSSIRSGASSPSRGAQTEDPFATLSSTASDSTTLPATSTGQATGLSKHTKTPIGIGVALSVLFCTASVRMACWYGRRAAKERDNATSAVAWGKAELGPGAPVRKELGDTSIPVGDTAESELDRRRRAAELDSLAIMPCPAELDGASNGAELDNASNRP